MRRQVSDERVESVANGILDLFGVDVRTDSQFDALCDIVEEVLRKGASANRLCVLLAKASLPEKVTVAVLATFLRTPLAEAQRAVAASASDPPAERAEDPKGFFDVEL